MLLSNGEKEGNILRNLEIFHLRNFQIVGRVKIFNVDSYSTLKRFETLRQMNLVHLCVGLKEFSHEVKHESKEWEVVDSKIISVFYPVGSFEIGHIDKEGIFYFEESSNLRECLGWLLATSIGRYGALNHDLDQEVIRLEHAIKYNFFKVFFERCFSGSFVSLSFPPLKVLEDMFKRVVNRDKY